MNKREPHPLTEQVKAAIRCEHMLRPGDSVLVALSGGADSMALLHSLLELREEMGLSGITAAHVNHGLRGEEARRDEEFVRQQCGRLNVPLLVHHADVAGEAAAHGEGLEEAGRRVRYAFLAQQAAEHQAVVATAHTLSDSVESVLLHLIRGSGLQGLTGIAPALTLPADPHPARVIRPLMDCTRREVEAYCAARAIPFVTDSTNSDVAYARNRVRHQIVPSCRAINPRAEEAFGRLTRHVREDVDCLNALAADALHRAAMTDGYGGYDAKQLAALPPALRSRAIMAAVAAVDGEAARSLTDRHLSRLEEYLSVGGALSLTGGVTVRVAQGRLFVATTKTGQNDVCEQNSQKLLINPVQFPVKPGISARFYDKIYRPTLLSLAEYEKQQKIHKNLLKNSLNYDKITGNLQLRSRCPGDAYRPQGRGICKSLKKLFGEAKVPVSERDSIPVLCDEQGIVLVSGFGCDERVSIDSTCRRVLVWETEETAERKG